MREISALATKKNVFPLIEKKVFPLIEEEEIKRKNWRGGAVTT